MEFDQWVLSRLQFGLTASFHIIFPSLIIGLSFYLTTMKILWVRTGNLLYDIQYRFWCNVLALCFAVAVVTGVVLSFQLDTLFNGLYSETRELLVPIRRLELMNLMLLEAGSIGIMLWGHGKVGERLHFVATFTFNFGVIVGAVLILARNSWMQTPAGMVIEDGAIRLSDWVSVILNPAFPYMYAHVLIGALLSTALVILGLSCGYLLAARHVDFSRLGVRFALAAIVLLAPLQVLSGHLKGLNTRDHQPVKLAALEGLWETEKRAPMVLFAIPDPEQETNRHAIEIPGLGSLLIRHDLNGEVQGLKSVPRADRPNVPVVFFAFRIMVCLGLLMLLLAATGVVLWRKGRLFASKGFLRSAVFMAPAGIIATIAGWCVTEVGRQPWVIYGLVRTHEVIHPAVAAQIGRSLTIVGVAYGVLAALIVGAAWTLVRSGPQPIGEDHGVGRDAFDARATGRLQGIAALEG